MAAIASERLRTLAGKVDSSEGGGILQAELSINKYREKNGHTLECLHVPLREMTTPTE